MKQFLILMLVSVLAATAVSSLSYYAQEWAYERELKLLEEEGISVWDGPDHTEPAFYHGLITFACCLAVGGILKLTQTRKRYRTAGGHKPAGQRFV